MIQVHELDVVLALEFGVSVLAVMGERAGLVVVPAAGGLSDDHPAVVDRGEKVQDASDGVRVGDRVHTVVAHEVRLDEDLPVADGRGHLVPERFEHLPDRFAAVGSGGEGYRGPGCFDRRRRCGGCEGGECRARTACEQDLHEGASAVGQLENVARFIGEYAIDHG